MSAVGKEMQERLDKVPLGRLNASFAAGGTYRAGDLSEAAEERVAHANDPENVVRRLY